MWKNKLLLFLSMMAFIVIFFVFEEASAFTETKKNKVIVLSIPSLSFYEFSTAQLQPLSSFSLLYKQSRAAAVNVRISGGIDDVYATLGAGVPTVSRSDIKALNKDETINKESGQTLYARYNGSLNENAQIVVPEISVLYELNEDNRYQSQIGLLGEVLKQNGVSTYLYGNRDRGIVLNDAPNYEKKRLASLMLMDSNGLIPFGNIGAQTVIKNELRPFSIQTNYDWIYEQLQSVTPNSLVLIELGDLDRLYVDKSFYAPERFQLLKQEILKEMDDFLGKVISNMGQDDALFVFSPQVHRDAREEKLLLSPLFYYEHELDSGLLTSATTRRTGILSHVDIAPSLLHLFQVTVPSEMIGNIAKFEENKEMNISWLEQELNKIQNVYQLRPMLLYSFVTYEVIVLILTLLVAIGKWIKWTRIVNPFLFSILIAPVVMLWMGYFSGYSVLVQALFFLMITLLLSLMLQYFSVITVLTLISLCTSFMILLDGMFGAYAMKHSVLGYDVMIGARYYGIGNEFMGVLIGSTALAASMLFYITYLKYPNITKWMLTVYLLIVVFYLAAPFLGTNAGGTITAVVTFTVFWVKAFKEKWLRNIHWAKLAVYCGTLGIAALVLLWLFNDLFISDKSKVSHIGKAMDGLFKGNVEQIINTVIRKVSMNWHLIQVSAWSKVFLTSLIVVVLFILKPKGKFQEWHDKYYSFMIGFYATTVGTIVVFFVNDSGIVAAATMIVYVAIPMLLLKIDDIDEHVRT
ncbi:hypothetical protein [Chengkuizengella axinellae]|uniref:Uncharacterized protein n=1 Tax=Chengkuizengella axinellae TaxID=3064388 RepID=A0ABT9J4X5_9BACL|nr:hypothetical protein [Chengkuizengella sp. 2205SS18-9]MDP5276650.1 hypothetical protein [Chengkuizengella sp. 2205SS18-9]